MEKFCTVVTAVDPIDGDLKTFIGPDIEASSKEEAVQLTQENGLGYCKVTGDTQCY